MRKASSTVFTGTDGQIVRLPKAVAFPDDVRQVDILKIGQGRVVVPRGKRWDDLFLGGPRVDNDFVTGRQHSRVEKREPL